MATNKTKSKHGKAPARAEGSAYYRGALEREREMTRCLLKGIKDGLIFLDPQGRISRMNPVMEFLLGLTEKEAAGKKLCDATREKDVCLLITSLSSSKAETFRIKGRLFEVTASEVLSKNGARMGSITLFHDVTEARRLEKQRTDFLSMVTHDLKTPLTTILGFSALILEGSMGEVSPEVKESVEAMDKSGRKLLGIIDDFLTISRFDAGLIKPEAEPVDIDGLVRGVVSGLTPRAELGGKSIKTSSEKGLPRVFGDRSQLERALSNLLDNALKFTGEHGNVLVRLSLVPETRIQEMLGTKPAEQGLYVEVVVQDDGIGISAEDLPHIFDRYWRGCDKSGIKGTGLGLAIVKSVVEAHSGFLHAESTEGAGASFYVWLPAASPA